MKEVGDRFVYDDTVRLPDTMHGLVRVVIDDVRKVVDSAEDRIDMADWARRSDDADSHKCVVCAAGAVMIGTLKVDMKPGRWSDPSDFDTETYNKLMACDYLRRGHVSQAAAKMYYGRTLDEVRDKLHRAGFVYGAVDYISFDPDDPEPWFTKMEALHARLVAADV